MFHQILVAVDRSEMGRQVLAQAIELATMFNARLNLVNVLAIGDEESPNMPVLTGHDFYPGGLSRSVVEIYEELWQDYTERRLKFLRTLADEAIAMGVTTDIYQMLGSPGQSICELAHDINADLIILGRRGLSGLNELFLGSTSNYVLHYAPCSVLTVQGSIKKDVKNPETKQIPTVV